MLHPCLADRSFWATHQLLPCQTPSSGSSREAGPLLRPSPAMAGSPPRCGAVQDMDFTAVLVLATLRSSQLEAVEAARHSARSHQAGRTPNIPGDTPWTRAGAPVCIFA